MSIETFNSIQILNKSYILNDVVEDNLSSGRMCLRHAPLVSSLPTCPGPKCTPSDDE